MELIKKKKEKEKLNHSFMFKWCMVKGVPCIEFSVWCYTYNKNKSTVYEVEKALIFPITLLNLPFYISGVCPFS